MASEPTLYARMELRLNEFEKKLARATAVTDKTMGNIERRGARMTASLSGLGSNVFGGLIKGAALALGPILGVSAAINGAKDALSAFGDISDSSKAAGLDAEFFQSLAYQAKLAGVDIGTLSGSLATFNRNSGLADAGTGRMVTALQKLNPALLDSIRNATNQEQRVRLAADALAAAGSASEKAALAVALFGDSGTKLVDAFAGGSAAIDQMQVKARGLGLIVDRELIARADQLGDEFDTVTQVVDIQLKQALVNLGPTLIYLTQLAGGLASTIGYIADGLKQTGDQSTSNLEKRLEFLQKGGQGITGKGGTAALEAAELKRQADIAAVTAELRSRAIDNLRTQLTAPKPIDFPAAPEDAPLPEIGGGGSGRNAAAASAIQHGEAVQKLIADLEFEKQTIGETALEQEVLNTLRNAGVDATSAEGLAIRGLVTDLDAQKSALQANADAMRQFEDIATNALSSFIGDLREGKSGAEALGNAMNSILDSVIQIGLQALVSGIGNAIFPGLGSVASSLFADGGYTGNGSRNQPAGVVHKGEYVFTKAETARLGAGNLQRLAKGYANGGYVGAPGPVGTMIQPPGPLPSRASGGSGNIHVTVGVSSDSAGNLTPYIESVADNRVSMAAPHIATAAVRAAIAQTPGAVQDYQTRRR